MTKDINIPGKIWSAENWINLEYRGMNHNFSSTNGSKSNAIAYSLSSGRC